MNEEAFNGALEVAGAVLDIGTLMEKEVLGGIGRREDETSFGGRLEDPALDEAEFDIKNPAEFGLAEGLEDDDFVEAIHELGGEFAAGGFNAGAGEFGGEFLIGPGGGGGEGGGKAEAAAGERFHFFGAEIGSEEDQGAAEVDFAVIAEGEGSFVEDAEQEVPEGVGGLFDLVEEDEAEPDLVGVVLVEHLLAEERVGFAVAEVAGRRADELGDFVAVLEFGAIDFNDGAIGAGEGFGGGFDDPGLAGAGGAEEEEVADGAMRGAEAGEVHLVDIDNLGDGFILADNQLAEAAFERRGFAAGPVGIEEGAMRGRQRQGFKQVHHRFISRLRLSRVSRS